MKATLGDGASLYDAVCLPTGENRNEWIAVSLVDFYNDLSLLFGGISELCTKTTCPVMSAGPNFQYLWPTPTGPVKLSAHDYIDNLFIWIDEQIDDPAIFPFEDDQDFPKVRIRWVSCRSCGSCRLGPVCCVVGLSLSLSLSRF